MRRLRCCILGRVRKGQVCCPGNTNGRNKGLSKLLAHVFAGVRTTYNLVLDRHDSEVDHLHSWPDQPVGLECRNVDVLELLLHGALSTALGDGHESEEARETWECQWIGYVEASMSSYQLGQTETGQRLHA